MGVCLGSKTTTLQREINYTSDEINNKPQSNNDEIENDYTKESLNKAIDKIRARYGYFAIMPASFIP